MKKTVAINSNPRALFTCDQFSEKHPAWTNAALRNLILNSEKRTLQNGKISESNGLDKFRAIIRVGRKILIDEQAFFAWLADLQKTH